MLSVRLYADSIESRRSAIALKLSAFAESALNENRTLSASGHSYRSFMDSFDLAGLSNTTLLCCPWKEDLG